MGRESQPGAPQPIVEPTFPPFATAPSCVIGRAASSPPQKPCHPPLPSETLVQADGLLHV